MPPQELREALRTLRDALGYRYYVTGIGAEREEQFEVSHALRHPGTGDHPSGFL